MGCFSVRDLPREYMHGSNSGNCWISEFNTILNKIKEIFVVSTQHFRHSFQPVPVAGSGNAIATNGIGISTNTSCVPSNVESDNQTPEHNQDRDENLERGAVITMSKDESQVNSITNGASEKMSCIGSEHLLETETENHLDGECPTCLEEYEPENPKIIAKCLHHFHLSCIYAWMERSDKCPICFRVMEFTESV